MRTLTTAILAAALAALPTGASAQEAPNPNQSLADATARLQAETAKLQAETALWNARFGGLPTGKEGAISVNTGSAYAIGALARVYAQVDKLAKRLCTKLGAETAKEKTASVVLVGDRDAMAATRHFIANEHLKLLASDIGAFLALPAMEANALAIGPILAGAIAVAKLFRVDRKLFAEKSDIDSAYLQDKVAQCLEGERLLYPAAQASHTLFSPAHSPFIGSLAAVLGHRETLKGRTGSSDATEKAKAEALLARLDKLTTDVLKPPEGETLPPLVAIVEGEALSRSLEQATPPYVVAVHLAGQGGLSMITSSIWTSDRLYVGGGAIARYRVTRDAKLIAAGAESLYDPALERIRLGPAPPADEAPSGQ